VEGSAFGNIFFFLSSDKPMANQHNQGNGMPIDLGNAAHIHGIPDPIIHDFLFLGDGHWRWRSVSRRIYYDFAMVDGHPPSIPYNVLVQFLDDYMLARPLHEIDWSGAGGLWSIERALPVYRYLSPSTKNKIRHYYESVYGRGGGGGSTARHLYE
jgi:hypothetical protein